VPVDLTELTDDLRLETAALDAVLAPLADAQWRTTTPAPGWNVHDQVSHLAYFDGATLLSAQDPAAFALERVHASDDVDAYTAEVAARYRALPHAELLAWFRDTRAELIDRFVTLDPARRIPWYGPDLSVAAALTARIMETWAHGQDVVDALGATRPPTRALRQVAHICVRALPNSFRTHRLPTPETAVRVTLTGPDGDEWTWGDPDAAESVTGTAEEFCLVATRRRHVDDTALLVVGPVATQWMQLAQAYAGPPGAGRRPGQFADGGR
jgi:uncharacterized protein (TIGR03084 family)